MPPTVSPNFLVIGAPRSGTTSLCQYLKQHPDVYLSPKKEPKFFAFGEGDIAALAGPGARFLADTTIATMEEYCRIFEGAGDRKTIGEASPRYLWAPGTAARIHAALPNAKLIAILRQPADRAYAGYLAARRDGREALPRFEDALREQRQREEAGWAFGVYARPSYYHRHLSKYFQLFCRRQIHVILFEDFRHDPRGVLRDLFRFLQIDPEVPIDVSEVHGRTGVIRNPLLRALWRASREIPEPVRAVVSPNVRDRWMTRITRSAVKPELSAKTRLRLTEHFRDDILSLETLLQRDLSSWLSPDATRPAGVVHRAKS